MVHETAAATPPRSIESSRLRMETDAVLAGTAAAAVCGVVAVLLFAGREVPLWGGFSVGAVAAIGAVASTVVVAYLGYWRARHRPGQEWRLAIRPWMFVLDATTVSLVHAALAGIFTASVFVVLQRSFDGLRVDVIIGTICVAAAAGASGYLSYLSVSDISTRKMATLLVSFMALATLASIAAVEDEYWWEYHFSQLGTAGDFSAWLFNATLIVAGFFVTTFTLYLHRDLAALVDAGLLEHRWAPRLMSTAFVVLGIMLAGVGLFPLHVNMAAHNGCASGMAAAFAIMVLGSPYILRGLPRRFFVFCYATFGVLIGGFLLFVPIGYYNLTAFELVAFTVIFSWITVFIRFVDALADAPAAAPDPGRTPTATTPVA
ncbi:DUF998 domain-containing protein [Agromyces sp. LHK192]|uniref:DUF998 domain-containing protein n=1 Tax=Agromyces sp. LHK192 TaxID=2498704 RepID=UPI0013E2B957|nr:DUF998 domain-containing protein [Agromyces sp. LHK192]